MLTPNSSQWAHARFSRLVTSTNNSIVFDGESFVSLVADEFFLAAALGAKTLLGGHVDNAPHCLVTHYECHFFVASDF